MNKLTLYRITLYTYYEGDNKKFEYVTTSYNVANLVFDKCKETDEMQSLYLTNDLTGEIKRECYGEGIV